MNGNSSTCIIKAYMLNERRKYKYSHYLKMTKQILCSTFLQNITSFCFNMVKEYFSKFTKRRQPFNRSCWKSTMLSYDPKPLTYSPKEHIQYAQAIRFHLKSSSLSTLWTWHMRPHCEGRRSLTEISFSSDPLPSHFTCIIFIKTSTKQFIFMWCAQA